MKKTSAFTLIETMIALVISIISVGAIYSSYLFFAFMGISNGLANVLGSSTWAEIYGVRYLGSIKALTTALMVFSTAFGTAVFGVLIDKGFTIEFIALISIIYISISLFALLVIKRTVEPVILIKKT